MLCGQFLSVATTAASPHCRLLVPSATAGFVSSPYYTLLTLCHGMAALTSNHNTNVDDEDIFLENGLLSYENPNYHLDPARLDDALNSNTDEDLYEDLYHELDAVCKLSGGNNVGLNKPPTSTGGQGRRNYANLDIGSMGVDITTGPVTNLDTNDGFTDNRSVCEKTQKHNQDNSDDIGDNTVPHIQGGLNNDLYAVPVKRRPQNNSPPITGGQHIVNDSPEQERRDENLPPGWEKHEDNDGPYYWHIKSGTIQRELPEMPACMKENKKSSSSLKDSDNILKYESSMISSVTRSSTSSALDMDLEERKRKDDVAFKRRSYPARAEPDSKERPIRFAVRSLGWVEIAEDDLTPERSSKAVNKCIVDLSLGRNDLLDVVGRWGDGKDLFMDLDEGALKLIDPENLTVLNTQPIHTIRVWGVGRDNGRDFAYVARDRTTRKHMCHVFRCDMPARTIANTLRDICKRIMIERSLQQSLAKPVDISSGRSSLATRPTNLPTEHRRSHRNGQTLVTQSFPTPMEEPKKILRAQYLGSTQVAQATGMDTLNDAIDLLSSRTPDTWQQVNVAVAPSMISILHPGDDNRLIAECRVRYLSFLGIGRNVKQCAFIMHTAQDLFIAHVFHCEPSSGALCKTIEAACKLRYQKCLDAHPQGQAYNRNQSGAHTPGRGLGATLKSLVGSLTGRRSRGSES
ncbi:protein Fe65 homolog isoform X2 [Chrysoperla carnea]|uniref:protein Fe65 homolog isoform X2 n=1 Tax=Chrysoperla carnea TaxID=189513 RepID=UPI001D07C833|nr:protein Fe65 homolog isoform X2 [Chrysoperla carnea]